MTTKKTNLAIGALVFAGAAAVGLSFMPPHYKTADFVRPVNAATTPRVVEIQARKFQFTPAEVTLKKGEPVILRLTSADRAHGFLLKPLKIDADIAPGKTVDVAVTPTAAGNYTVICDHYCGTGHGNMKMKLTVVE